MADVTRSVLVQVTGIVQGVGYRAWAADEARRLGLSGWVRNRRDGSVEARFSGSAEAVEAMIAACHQGPRNAAVSRVEVAESPEPAGPGFAILATALTPTGSRRPRSGGKAPPARRHRRR